jgi:hypothetical protein
LLLQLLLPLLLLLLVPAQVGARLQPQQAHGW